MPKRVHWHYQYGSKRAAQRAELVSAALESGRFRFQQYSSRIKCTICGRSGYMSGYWLDNCLQGHVHTCWCGRAFASKQALATHRRHGKHLTTG